MDSVYLLWHTHELGVHRDDEKLIGVYTSRENAEAAKSRVMNQPGFVDYPGGFEIAEYKLDRDHWTKGFVAVD